MVSGNFFDLLGVQPEIGRFFDREESGDEQNAHPEAVISHDYWMNHYQGQSSVVGAKLRLNRTVFTIIGVAPKSFYGSWAGLGMQIRVPITMYGQVTHTGTWMLRDRNTRNFMVLARLKPGVTIEQARSETRALADVMAKADADSDQGVGADVLPLWKSHFGSEQHTTDANRHPLGRQRTDAADRLCQRRQPPAGTRHRPPEGIQHPHGSGRDLGTSDTGAPDRSLAGGPGRLVFGSPHCELAEWFPGMADSRSLYPMMLQSPLDAKCFRSTLRP